MSPRRGLIISTNAFDKLYVIAPILSMVGRSGEPGLWMLGVGYAIDTGYDVSLVILFASNNGLSSVFNVLILSYVGFFFSI